MLILYTLLGISAGLAIAIQSAINSGLRQHLHSPFLTSAVSFGVGTLALLLVCLFTKQSLPDGSTVLQSAWWLWIGGALGVIGLTTNILIFPHLGAIQTAIMPILGQILMGLLIDTFGWFHLSQQDFTTKRFIGLMLSLLGIFLAVVWANRQRFEASIANKALWFWRILGIIAGMITTTQAAVNGQLGVMLHSPLLASLWSFMLGSILLWSYAIFIEGSAKRLFEILSLNIGKIWWTGGLLGAWFVLGNATLVPSIGAGQTVMLVLLGMILGSLCLEQGGFLGAKQKAISTPQIIGLMALLIGVALIRLL
ncbi:MAG: DMT family transporter [Cardiobacteriaceae bacterium]|nr:DMT family transporter [Cardiobacteriaceae bacterium]